MHYKERKTEILDLCQRRPCLAGRQFILKVGRGGLLFILFREINRRQESD